MFQNATYPFTAGGDSFTATPKPCTRWRFDFDMTGGSVTQPVSTYLNAAEGQDQASVFANTATIANVKGAPEGQAQLKCVDASGNTLATTEFFTLPSF